ncbi:tRNA dihydrouridine(20/20a) synthase DusA [uncultured Kiloniella sp.]|uniref:tRNA dihydrouridine(20/20a) synthase DusA n=1 Tax=uncultured Kiloniella sp. TaxID=1133091 RepID=UPI0026399999|nr:tRNA dihydrouridine(20/20a) synthase DusA [uncultured Kiloniella sp.]
MKKKTLNRKVCVAPMLDWTDRHYRYFARLISKHAVLYTEMITTGALIHGDRDRYLQFNRQESPLALQLGGSNPEELATCAKMAEDLGYDEVNLNVGCPSDRVQNNMIGACLMGHPELVADCVSAMKNAASIPVTVKHRIGIDDQDSYEELHHFVNTVAVAGCSTFIVHARKAILQGLSPKENRDIPPLKYDVAYQLKQDFSSLELIINGGIKTIDECREHINHLDGVMVGREAYQNPWLLSHVDEALYGSKPSDMTRLQVVEAMIPYIEEEMNKGSYLGHITRHILGIFHGMPGGKKFRRYISENAHKPGATVDVLKHAINIVSSEQAKAQEHAEAIAQAKV